MRIETPLTREEIKIGDLIPAGTYTYEVLDATDTISSKGNDMIKLKLRIFMEDGRTRILHDYLMEALKFKLAHFAEANGLYQEYSTGMLTGLDCIGKSGELKIFISKDKTGQYGDQSSVGDYLLPDIAQTEKTERKIAEAKAAAPVDDSPLIDDADLPF